MAAAIDFGTHGSGFAWCAVHEGEEPADRQIDFFDQWKDQPVSYPKNLTALLLDADGRVLEWGYAARRARANRVEGRLETGFKTWLRPDAGEGGTPGEAKDLAAAYLRELRGRALTSITGGGFHPDDVRWCLTVPAIWDDAERNLMRQAAEEAGFPAGRERLILVTEPEAAAVYCAVDRSAGVGGEEAAPTLVVDCGGGTVDIAGYRDRGDGTLEELCTPVGGKQGSDYINRRFEQEMAQRIGPAAYRALQEREHELLSLLDGFEGAKTAFRVDSDEPTRIPLSFAAGNTIVRHGGLERLASCQNGVDDEIVLTADVMRTLFEGTVDPLVRQVVTQIRSLLAAVGPGEALRVVVVGGFAQSLYVRSRLTEAVGEAFGTRVRIVVPPSPARAVLAGAVHYACRPEIVHSRRARGSYGATIALPSKRFERGEAATLPRRKGSGGRGFRLGHLQVFVRAGDSVRVGSEWRMGLVPVDEADTRMRVGVYSSPDRTLKTVNSPGAREIGEVVVDISESLGLPPEKRGVEVVFRFGGTEIEVSGRNPRTGELRRTVLNFRSVPEPDTPEDAPPGPEARSAPGG
ncbi:Hsp70 family protein [Streptomyces genisteinicus]|uniref:Hsp70 family protein n=1 Tax=Streptomyces genisteinicus TaxID=2768068 RepID=A0A7H0I036_9ACTN|nr:Hsp70 family protein [Streptomyces genisteinicus]QNP66152.1 Hsp70 family protein [Streptomyces genisteinicus]